MIQRMADHPTFNPTCDAATPYYVAGATFRTGSNEEQR
jgi:hypothetical protein